ncbi:MAG: glycosyltransferase family 2 protein [bacterium]
MFIEASIVRALVLVAYFGLLAILAFYGSHRYLMVYLYRRHQGPDAKPLREFSTDELPVVTIQLPLFNERYVCERLIDAVCRIDYPTDRLEIQVLDDSTDDTFDIVKRHVDRWQAEGVDIKHIHRTDRVGYKAGALEAGQAVARGEFVAIFDADFIPQEDFLLQTIHHFTEPSVGMVQTRWDHINRGYSLLTAAQAVLLDGHFVIEHTARNRSGRLFNFNGTAGIWRRSVIADAGGWQHDTLTEDLDLSYRAQMKGWKFVFLRDVAVPSELPVEMSSLKSQQHRWAKGSIQTAMKLLPTILRSELPNWVKLEAFYHLTANAAYLLLVMLAVLMPVATVIRMHEGWMITLMVDLPIFLGATVSICTFYWTSQRELGRRRIEILRLLPAVMGLGIGLSLNNAKAVLEALVRHETPFVRTPKYAIARRDQSWTGKSYFRKGTVMPLLEFLLGAWFTASIVFVISTAQDGVYSLPFLMLFQFGFLYVACLSAWHGVKARSGRARAALDVMEAT